MRPASRLPDANGETGGCPTSPSGHRDRLRQRFLRAGIRGFTDREALELLLTFARPRIDTRSLSERLIGEFGSLRSVLSQPPEMISRVPGAGDSVSVLLGLVPALAAHAIRPGEMQVLDSAGAVRQYLRERLGLMRRERLVALLLDSSGRLLAEKDLEFGTVDRASVHPRNLLEKVIATNATGVILVHNHPGGRAEPSSEDLALTSRLQELGKSLGFRVLDHFIVTEEATVSLRELGRMSQ